MKAAEAYEKAIATGPGRFAFQAHAALATTYWSIAILLKDRSYLEKARVHLETALNLKPDDVNVKKNYERLMQNLRS